MKKLSLILLFAISCAAVYAQDNNANWSLAFETSSYTYQEPSAGVKLNGPKYGVSLEYMARNAQSGGLFLDTQFLYMTGSVTYNGALFDGTPYTASGIQDYYFETRGMLGLTLGNADQNGMDFWPYVGVGYRRLFNGMGADQYGYNRTSTYTYLPAGMKARFKMVNGWNLAFTGEYDIFLGGRQESDIAEAIINNQSTGYGLRGSAQLSKNLGRVSLFVEPFYRYWNIGESDVAYSYALDEYLYEPANHTDEYGVKIGIGF